MHTDKSVHICEHACADTYTHNVHINIYINNMMEKDQPGQNECQQRS